MTAELSRAGTEILALAWPDGVPPMELALLRTMPPDRAAKTMDRLAAVISAEEGGNIGDLAASVGMDRHHFFRLRSRWRLARSLRSLAPFAGRKPRSSGSDVLDDLAAELVLASEPGASAGSRANALVRSAGAGTGRTQALKAVRSARLRQSTRPESLARFFGRAVLVDVTPIDLTISESPGLSRYAMGAFVVERSTGLVLGHAAGHDYFAVDLQHEALVHSLAIVTDVAPEAQPAANVEFVAAEGGDVWRRELRDRLEGPDTHVVDLGERRFGERLVSLIGRRVGRITLRPRALGHVPDNTMYRFLTEHDVRALFDEAVHDFNAARLDQLVDDFRFERRRVSSEPAREFVSLAMSVPGADVGVGMMVRALRELARRLELI